MNAPTQGEAAVRKYDGDERRPREPEPWHLKKEINISLILVLIGQMALGVWYVADFNAWRHQATEQLAEHSRLIIDGQTKTQDLTRELADRLARIETKIDSLTRRRED
jgi:hypothetical protein